MAATKSGHLHKLAQLAKALERYGTPPNISESVAAGVTFSLVQWCWANVTDIVGDSIAVETITGTGDAYPPGVLARLMVKYKILVLAKNRYVMPMAYTDRPTRIDRAWRRRGRSYRAAKQRAVEARSAPLFITDEGSMLEALDTAEDAEEMDELGRRNPKKKRKRKESHGAGTPGHAELVKYWCDQWAERESYGVKYPFCPTDAAHIKRLIERTDCIEQAKAVIDAYLSCRDKFFTGKDLKRLIYALPRFVSAAAGGMGGKQETLYRGNLDIPEA